MCFMFDTTFFIGAILAALAGYLLGSLCFAIILSKLIYHKDVRQFGSGNAGMTNILRTFGKKAAALVLIGDFLKGVAAVYVGSLIFNWLGITLIDGGYIGGFFAILGHLFPLYFGFKGGKGVVTTAGVVLMIDPLVLVIMAVPMVSALFIIKIVSLVSVSAAALYPLVTYLVLSWQGKPALVETLFTIPISLLIIYMHRANIKRLLNGTEHRFGQKKEDK